MMERISVYGTRVFYVLMIACYAQLSVRMLLEHDYHALAVSIMAIALFGAYISALYFSVRERYAQCSVLIVCLIVGTAVMYAVKTVYDIDTMGQMLYVIINQTVIHALIALLLVMRYLSIRRLGRLAKTKEADDECK